MQLEEHEADAVFEPLVFHDNLPGLDDALSIKDVKQDDVAGRAHDDLHIEVMAVVDGRAEHVEEDAARGGVEDGGGAAREVGVDHPGTTRAMRCRTERSTPPGPKKVAPSQVPALDHAMRPAKPSKKAVKKDSKKQSAKASTSRPSKPVGPKVRRAPAARRGPAAQPPPRAAATRSSVKPPPPDAQSPGPVPPTGPRRPGLADLLGDPGVGTDVRASVAAIAAICNALHTSETFDPRLTGVIGIIGDAARQALQLHGELTEERAEEPITFSPLARDVGAARIVLLGRGTMSEEGRITVGNDALCATIIEVIRQFVHATDGVDEPRFEALPHERQLSRATSLSYHLFGYTGRMLAPEDLIPAMAAVDAPWHWDHDDGTSKSQILFGLLRPLGLAFGPKALQQALKRAGTSRRQPAKRKP